MGEDTPEARLAKFAKALETNDLSLFPEAYNGSDPMPCVKDIQAVLARLKVAEDANG